MPETSVDRFLAQVDESAKRLDPALRSALHNEIAAHLDAAIQARMELGDSPDEAERSAIAAFGDVKRIVKGVAEVNEVDCKAQSQHVAFVGGFFAVFAGGMAASWSGRLSDSATVLGFYGTALPLLVAIFVTAFRARRLRWGRLLLLYPLIAIGFGTAGSISQVPTVPLIGNGIRRQDLDRLAMEADLQASRYDAVALRVSTARQAFEMGENIGPVFMSMPESPRMEAAATREVAVRRWKRLPLNLYEAFAQGQRHQAAEYRRWATSPWRYALPYQTFATQFIAVPWFLTMLAVSTLAVWVRIGTDRIRPRRRGRAQPATSPGDTLGR